MVHMRSELKQTIQILRKHIIEDLQTTDYNRDPFGYCNYLLFLLENNFEHDCLDNLVDWMNTFVREVIVEKKISRSADNEITTAIFGHYILEKHKRLHTEIAVEQINDVLEGYIDDKGLYFKQNITYTICLAISLFNERSRIYDWEKMRNALCEEYKENNLQRDPKNLCYYNLLLEIENRKKKLHEFSKWVADILIKNETSTRDKPYYLWIAWRNRCYIKKEFKIIKNKITTSLDNFLINIQTEEEPQSKIIKSLYYDIAKNFGGRTILISLDEYREPNFFARIGGLFTGLILIIFAVITLYFSQKTNLLPYAIFKFISTKDLKIFLWSSVKFLMSIVLLSIELFIVFVGCNILWEVCVKNRYIKHEVVTILKPRSSKFFKWILLVIMGHLIFKFLTG